MNAFHRNNASHCNNRMIIMLLKIKMLPKLSNYHLILPMNFNNTLRKHCLYDLFWMYGLNFQQELPAVCIRFTLSATIMHIRIFVECRIFLNDVVEKDSTFDEYTNGSHFVSIVRDFSTDRLFFCDGMTQFVEFKASAGKFPITISRKRLVKAYLVRSEYAINTSNRY